MGDGWIGCEVFLGMKWHERTGPLDWWCGHAWEGKKEMISEKGRWEK